MSRVAENIISMLDKGQSVFDVAKFFGGIHELLDITKKYPYLLAMVQTKLGGDLHCSAENEDGDMIPFSLNFIINELVEDDDEMFGHYVAFVNVIIPELTEGKEIQILYTWLGDYLSDLGAEVGQFNDGKLNNKMIWVHVTKINGMLFKVLEGGVSDEEVLEIIPEEYKNP
jgi:hypothetical protein